MQKMADAMSICMSTRQKFLANLIAYGCIKKIIIINNTKCSCLIELIYSVMTFFYSQYDRNIIGWLCMKIF